MSNKKYLTSPIFYANSNPHIGHLYTGLICDVWKQINSIMGSNVFFSSGMDEHGQKVFQSAQINGYSTQEYVDNISDCFVKFFAQYNVRYDYWVKTTSKEHKKSAQYFWMQLEERGYIYKNQYEGWYSISDENYLDVGKDYVSTSPNIVWREEECYYFKLSAFEDQLLQFYAKNIDAIYPKSRYNEAVAFIKQGLKDFSISRPKDRLSWGIPIPNDPDQVMYVWIDALTNYLSVINYPDEKYKQYWPGIHVIGKDILKFHTVYWPALLMAIDIEPPKLVLVHGWWLNGDQKVSKSLNNAIDIAGLSETYGFDSVRYFLLANMTVGEDANFKESLFDSTVGSVLSNKFGNFLLRLIGMAQNNEMNIIKVSKVEGSIQLFLNSLELETMKFVHDITYFDEYMSLFTTSLDFLNNYINENTIWKQEKEQLEKSLYSLLYSFKVISIIFSPILPETVKKITEFFDIDFDLLSAKNHKDIQIKEPIILFPKVNF